MRESGVMRESGILQSILLACSRGATRLFRQNVGQGWVGESRRFSRAATVVVEPGDVLIRKARPLHAGLCEGSSDLIGWRSVTITPDMVGERVALFVAVEVKSQRGRPTDEQVRFLAAVRGAGGVAFVARSAAEAEAALQAGPG